jgi:hypothetical protein
MTVASLRPFCVLRAGDRSAAPIRAGQQGNREQKIEQDACHHK